MRLIGIGAALLSWGLAAVLAPAPVNAEDSAPIMLDAEAADIPAEVQGITAGRNSLTQMAARDRRRKVCLGYAAVDPNHTLILTADRPHLRIAVDSGGKDTTLLIRGPRGIDCNDNRSRGYLDAAITARDWPAGTYQIWVGSFHQGEQITYRLRIFDPSLSADD